MITHLFYCNYDDKLHFLYAGGSHVSTLKCLYDCLLDNIFLFYQNKLILILMPSSVLNVLRVCYEDVFSEHCGPNAGSAIGGLMSDVFDDPLYLRFQSKPDCQAHNHEYHQQMADVPPRSVPRIRPYSKAGRSSSTTGRRSSDIVNIHVQMDDQSTSVNLDSGQHPDYVESSDLKLGASMEHNSAASGATLVISINFYVVLSVLLTTVCTLFTTTLSRTVPHRWRHYSSLLLLLYQRLCSMLCSKLYRIKQLILWYFACFQILQVNAFLCKWKLLIVRTGSNMNYMYTETNWKLQNEPRKRIIICTESLILFLKNKLFIITYIFVLQWYYLVHIVISITYTFSFKNFICSPKPQHNHDTLVKYILVIQLSFMTSS